MPLLAVWHTQAPCSVIENNQICAKSCTGKSVCVTSTAKPCCKAVKQARSSEGYLLIKCEEEEEEEEAEQ